MNDQEKAPLKTSFFNKLSLVYKKQDVSKQQVVPEYVNQEVQQPQIKQDQYLKTEQYLQDNQAMYEQYHQSSQEKTQKYLLEKSQKEHQAKAEISNYQQYVIAKAEFMSSPKLQQQLVKLILKNQVQHFNSQLQMKQTKRLQIEDAIINKCLNDFKQNLEQKIISQCNRHKAVFEDQMQRHYASIRDVIRQVTMQKIHSLSSGNQRGEDIVQELVKQQVQKFLENKLLQYSMALSKVLNNQIQTLIEGSLKSIEDFHLRDRENVGIDIAQTLVRLQLEMRKIEGRLTESIQNIQNNVQHEQLKLIPMNQMKQNLLVEKLIKQQDGQ